MIITSKTYQIAIGKYPEGVKLTDSLIEYGRVGSITINSQNYNTGFTVTGNTLDISGTSYSLVYGDWLTVNFEYAIKINE